MRKNKSKKYSVIKYKGLEEEMSLLGFFCKKVVGAFAFEVIISIVKFAPEGTGYRAKTRFARFFNLPELISLFKESADIQTSDMLNLPVPEAEYINDEKIIWKRMAVYMTIQSLRLKKPQETYWRKREFLSTIVKLWIMRNLWNV